MRNTKMVLGISFVFLFSIQSAASPSDNTHSVKHLKIIRIKQAKELLGRYYKKSVVRTGEKISDVPDFVFRQVHDNLKGHFKKQARNLAWTIDTEAKKFGLDPIFLLSIIDYESSFNPLAKGKFGEIGLMQIKPDTAEWISKKYDLKWRGKKTLKDPCSNVKIGAAYVDYLRERFDDHGRLYLAAYNMGVTNVHRALNKNIWPKDYPSNVMQHYIKFYQDLREKELQSKSSVVIAAKSAEIRDQAGM